MTKRLQGLIKFYGIMSLIIGGMVSIAHGDDVAPVVKQSDEAAPIIKKIDYTVPLKATPIPLNHQDLTLNTVGKLQYMGGIQITSSKECFGGISSFIVSPDGQRILGVSDKNQWLVADLIYNNNNILVNIQNARMAPLKRTSIQKKSPKDQNLDQAVAPIPAQDQNQIAALAQEQSPDQTLVQQKAADQATAPIPAEGSALSDTLTLSGAEEPDQDSVNDAEAITAVDGAGYIVSFESPNALRYYQARIPDDYESLFTAIPQKITFAPKLPESYLNLPDNLGIEALTTLADGRMLAFSESAVVEGDHAVAQGWLIGRGKVEELSFEVSPSYSPTDMATMPNGDILVLERHFSIAKGMAARLIRIPMAAIKPGQRIIGETIADLAYPFNIDNMEALAVRKDAAGDTIIYIMSDNNFSKLQRNILMVFKLIEDKEKAPETISGFNRIMIKE